MPAYDYKCLDCEHAQEHFILPGGDMEKSCPVCDSQAYQRQVAVCKTDVRYSNPKESYNKKIAPHVKETYRQIGREALNDDTKTLDNLFGDQKVKNTLND